MLPHLTPAVSVRVVDDVETWDRLAGAWSSLFATSPAAVPPLQFDWLRTWWHVYMASEQSDRGDLRLFTCWRGPALVGVLPLYASTDSGQPFAKQRLRFISTGEDEREETCPDYMNLLAAPGEESACVAAIESMLSRHTWDSLDLLDMRQGSPLLGCSFESLAATRMRVVARGVCPIADLSGGFETYLQRLSPNTRQQARRFLREAERCGARLEFATPQTATGFFQDLVRLHQARWTAQGKPGCFAAERFSRFHSTLLDQWIGDGRVVVARLRVGTETLAAFHGFATGGKFDFYQCGIRIARGGQFKSPGTVGHLLLMRALSERGVTRYDFLRGASEYKDRLATDRVPLFSLHVWRTPRATTAAQFLARAAWRGVSRYSGPGAKSDPPGGANRNALVSAFVRTGAASTLSLARRWRGVMALTYHRIGDARGSLFDRGLWSASEDQFDCHVRLLKRNFEVINTAELAVALSRPKGRYVLITFDDGYRDNYERAFKILMSHRASATFFITTGFIDSPRLPWWDEIAWMVRSSGRAALDVAPYGPSPIPLDTPDRERAVRALLRVYKSISSRDTDAYLETLSRATGTGRYGSGGVESLWMTWDMLREMQASGMVIGGHTVDHTILARMDPQAQRSQIAGCATRLHAELGTAMDSFSYPVGQPHDFNQATRDCLNECGVKYAFSYYGGIRSAADWDQYDIRRIAVESDMSFDQFRAITLLPGIFGRTQ
jgi:peptidoglycan/xylan/chitin deacetylase (PgdA/CDA1 family)/CelD/BcsL family acetyltransferase involved in cellulose biosynthesis